MNSSTQTKKVQDSDAASVVSTSSFKSTTSLLKSKAHRECNPPEKKISSANKSNSDKRRAGTLSPESGSEEIGFERVY